MILVNRNEIASILNVPRNRIYRMLGSGKHGAPLPVAVKKKIGLYDYDAIIAWQSKNEIVSGIFMAPESKKEPASKKGLDMALAIGFLTKIEVSDER